MELYSNHEKATLISGNIEATVAKQDKISQHSMLLNMDSKRAQEMLVDKSYNEKQ